MNDAANKKTNTENYSVSESGGLSKIPPAWAKEIAKNGPRPSMQLLHYAAANRVTLCVTGDSSGPAREGVSIEEATKIATKRNPRLIYVYAKL